jgi:hypothetical protein
MIKADVLLDLAIGGASLGAWFAALFGLLFVTRPAEVAPVPATQDLGGGEPPAVVSLLANRWEFTEDAAESTLLDLAARRFLEFRQPGNDPMQTTIHVRGGDLSSLNPYERRVFDRVAGLAVSGVVPLPALTFRDPGSAGSWTRRLRDEVIEDARRRGLSQRRLSAAMVSVLGAAAFVAAAGVGIAVLHGMRHSHDALGTAFFAGLFTFGGLSTFAARSRGERDTATGREVASRWLGLKAYLRNDESFAELPPAAVGVWDRYLSYGDALGATRVCSAVIDLGMGNRKRVWSSLGGKWHRVRVRYPSFWGRYGKKAIGLAVWAVLTVLAGYGVLRYRHVPLEVAPTRYHDLADLVTLLLGLGLVIRGGYRLVRVIFDVALPVTLTGEVLWTEVWKSTSGGENSPPRPWLHYLAVDDGTDDRTTAWGLPSELSGRCDCGDTVTVKTRRWTRRVIDLTVVKRGNAGRLAEADRDEPIAVSGSSLGGQVLVGLLRPPAVQVGQLLTDDEVSRAIGQPVRGKGTSRSAFTGPMSVEFYQTVNGDKRALHVAVATGAAAQLAMRMRRRYQVLPGIGDEAFTGDNWAAARRGETIVLLQTHGPGRTIDPRNVYWLLATAVGRLPAS